MASGFVRKSDKGELSTCRHGRPDVGCPTNPLYSCFWTRSLEMDEWNGFY